MARDRLAALKACQSNEFTSIELQDLDGNNDNQQQQFYQEVQEIMSSIDGLKENVDEVKKTHSLILSTPQTEEPVKKRLEQVMADITSEATRIKAKLKRVQKETDLIGEQDQSSAEHRIRTTQYTMLFSKFKEVIEDYQLAQADHRDRCKARIKRQLEITGHVKTDDEIEDMIESGNPAIFNSEIMMETQQAKQSLAEIQARHSDILKLEKSIMELRDLFVEVATLVETQGEMINRIENHVAHAKNHVDKGAVEVNQAIAYQAKARWKKIICFIILILIITFIVVSVTYA